MKIGYVRVSTDDQNTDAQVLALKQAGCDAIYGDHGISGAVTSRKGLNDVLASLKAGDALVVYKVDRLGRSASHLLTLLDQLRQRGVDFIATSQGIDTTTPIGRLAFSQIAIFAEFERELLSQRTKAGMSAAKARGKHVGRPFALSHDQIIEAAERLKRGGITQKALAARYGVSPVTLARAIKRVKTLYQQDR